MSGQGSVSGTGISCGASHTDCTESFAPGDLVSLTATPADGMTFDGFSGACNGPTCQLAVATDATVAAAFSPPVVNAAPETMITKAPKKKLRAKRKATAKFEFSSSVPGSTFACALDGATPAGCASPKTYKVKPGKHTFSVVATAAGRTDPTPATFSFQVKRKKRKK